jgi:hypothetical protein
MNSLLKLRRAAFVVGFDVGTTVPGFIVGAAVVGLDVGTTVPGFIVGAAVVSFDVGTTVPGFIVGAAVVGFDVGDAVTSLVLYLLGHFSLLGFVMMYESTDKATLALLSPGVTQDLLKF